MPRAYHAASGFVERDLSPRFLRALWWLRAHALHHVRVALDPAPELSGAWTANNHGLRVLAPRRWMRCPSTGRASQDGALNFIFHSSVVHHSDGWRRLWLVLALMHRDGEELQHEEEQVDVDRPPPLAGRRRGRLPELNGDKLHAYLAMILISSRLSPRTQTLCGFIL